MKVLVTGNQGMIGSVIEATLKTEGFEVIGFDLANGDDIRNLDSVRDAASGCDFIVHLAALLGYSVLRKVRS
jgi:nucleoside-diphosphate-sugar epimerase